VIVLCAQEYQPPSFAFPGVSVLHVPIDDDPKRPMYDHEVMLVTSNAKTVARYLHTGQRVLVTCAMGLNRSALVAALAMRRAYGMSAEETIGQIRAARSPLALSNRNFVQLLQRYEE
jgi:protein-tyrosine phosphatase